MNVPSLMPSSTATGFNCLSTNSHTRPRVSTTGNGAKSASILCACRGSALVESSGQAWNRGLEGSGVAAAFLHSGDELLLFFGRHRFEPLHHPRLEFGTAAATASAESTGPAASTGTSAASASRLAASRSLFASGPIGLLTGLSAGLSI